MTIVPDDKDWTWVLDAPCPECGVIAAEIDPMEVGTLIRYCADRFTTLLTDGTEAHLRTRPTPDRWSPLEYACHVRDVLWLYEHRLALMLFEDDPLFPNWDQDVTAIDDDYGNQDPADVARELAVQAESAAVAFDRITGAELNRTGRRSDGASFTVDGFARYFIHDLLHHLVDVGEPIDDRPGARR